MDKKTLFKVIDMLNERYQEAKTFLEDNDLNHLDSKFVEGCKFAITEIKADLQNIIYADVDFDDSKISPPAEFWEPRRLSADELEDELPF